MKYLLAILMAFIATPAFADQWLVFKPNADGTYENRSTCVWISDAPPTPGVNVWRNAKVLPYPAASSSAYPGDYLRDGSDKLVLAPPVVPAPPPDPVAIGLLTFLETKASDAAVTDLQYARALRIQRMPRADQAAAWARLQTELDAANR